MDKYTAVRSLNEEPSSNILAVSFRAKEDKKQGNEVIDGSIGVFLNDDRSLNSVYLMKETLNEHISDNLSYPRTYGSDEFKTAMLKWFFKGYYQKVIDNYHTPFSITLGGTGALTIAFLTYLEAGQTILLPDIMWSNYTLIAEKAGLKYETYQLFDENGSFNFSSLKEKIIEVAKSQDKVFVLINDPCQNPTGYCMSDDEYHQLFDLLDEQGKYCSLVTLFDIAYLNYDIEGEEVHHSFVTLLERKHNFLPLYAASCSKTFGIYGLRVGALFSINNDEIVSKHLMSSIEAIVRGTYSCPNGPAMHCVAMLLNDEELRKKAEKEINHNTEILIKRGSHIKEAFNQRGIRYYPYQRGFFISVITNHAFAICRELEKKHIYLVPMDDNSIRIALSGIAENEIEKLSDELSNAIKQY